LRGPITGNTAALVAIQTDATLHDAFSKGVIPWAREKHRALFEAHPGFDQRPLSEIEAAMRQSPTRKKLVKVAIVSLNERFRELAAKESPRTPEYAACQRKKVEDQARTAAKELELEREMDEFLGLAVSVRTGDATTPRRLSQSLAKKHKPKKRAARSAVDLLACFRKKFG